MSIRNQIQQIEALRDKALSARERALAAAEKHGKEAEEYETAISVLKKLAPSGFQEFAYAARDSAKSGGFVAGSIASRILDLMRGSEKLWWTANEIQDALGAAGDEVKMTSISPNLTRLKESGDIVRDDLKVALADRAPKNTEAPEDDLLRRNSSGASDDDRPYQSVEPSAQGREAGPGGGT